METVPGEVMREAAGEMGARTSVRERRHWVRPEPRLVQEPSQLHREKPAEVRLRLQRRAPANLRHHFLRAVVRFTVLLVADLASFGLMRELVRAVRNYALVGDAMAGRLEAMLPPGILNGWQYAAALFVGLVVTGNYGRGDQRRNPRRLFLGAALATALPLWMTIWTRGLELALVQYGLVTVLVWIGLVLDRRTINQVMAWVRPPERDRMDVLFVGPGAECLAAMRTPAFSAGTEYGPIGFVDTQEPPKPGALGHLRDLPTVLAASGAQAVVISGYLSEQQFSEVVDTSLAGGCQVLSVPRSVQIAGVHPTTVWRGGQALVELTAPSLKGWQLLLKRLVDLTGSVVGLVVAAPLIGLIAVAIKLDSPGPVFFRQERIGTGGRRFRVWKFRTMRNGAPDAAHRELIRKMFNGQEAEAGHGNGNGKPVYKLVNDDRVTRVGRWLRRTSLDEVPQLFNVVRGEMSLVGPRPPLVYEFEAYDHWQFDRLTVSPGITGLWQVSGRNLLTYHQMCELDLEYVRRWSLWLDLKILFKTVPVVLFNSGRAA